jgi:AcrR family transcriptional regulator
VPIVSTHPRAPYDGDLRRDLLDAAIAMIGNVGPSGVSLRAVARQVGVSHAAPKNHFTSKRALFTSIAVEGHHLLADAITAEETTTGPRAELVTSSRAVARLAAAGRAYLRFAAAHPAHFAVMFRADLLDESDTELAAASEQTLGHLQAAATESLDDLALDPADADVLVLLAWSLVHGLASLHDSASLDDVVGDLPRDRVDDAVVALMARLIDARSR